MERALPSDIMMQLKPNRLSAAMSYLMQLHPTCDVKSNWPNADKYMTTSCEEIF